MEFVETGDAGNLLTWATILFVAALVFIVLLFMGEPFLDGHKPKQKEIIAFAYITSLIIMMCAVLASVILMIAFTNTNISQKAARLSGISEDISQTYAVNLSPEAVRANLLYPSVRPEVEFERYGTLTESKLVDERLVENSVTLVWAEGEMRLYGLDENKDVGAELPRVDEDEKIGK